MKKTVAVVGAGIFGVTVALRLSKNYEVDLYEIHDDILKSASSINQFRIHRGYHYPRSIETILAAKNAEPEFRQEYQDAVIDSVDHYYSIAKKNSMTSADEYLKVLNKSKLEYQITSLDLINEDKIDLTIKAEEGLINPFKLKQICQEKLKNSAVNLLLNTKATTDILKKYDQVVVCTYSLNNSLLDATKQQDYQYELCEKIVVRLPEEFNNISLVVLDGPFMCFDPYGTTGNFVMGNVVHAIHQTNIGKFPVYDKKFESILNNGVISVPELSKFKEFIESSQEFIPNISKAKYVGSMFTFRVVLPYKEKTDERPTLVNKVDDKIVTVFSGKIVSSVQAAKEVEEILK